MFSPIEWVDTKNGPVVRMLDQTRLPNEMIWVDCSDYEMVARGIRELWIRGAPAIGIAAAMGVALGGHSLSSMNHEQFVKQIQPIIDILAASRPTAVNLFWALARIRKVIDIHVEDSVSRLKERLVEEAKTIHQEEVKRNQAIGTHGSHLIKEGDTILTHCNTGALATGGHGTALGIIKTAWSLGKRLHVLVDETRPILQGSRLTMWELKRDNIPCTLITDNMAGAMMKKNLVQMCMVGADRIAANGDTANKIGTYSVAVLAKAHNIPFYVAAPTSTIDLSIDSGDAIPIEERNPEEVSNVMGKVRITPLEVEVANPAFDVTPAQYITGIITEHGLLRPNSIKESLGAS